jgi:thiol-disulfide isomerase/thioredoxin
MNPRHFGFAATLAAGTIGVGLRALDLSGAVAWFNSAPLTDQALRGKVVLVDIWTYSCINSLRQLPYVTRWAAKYKDAGLVVIGVHTPEFPFEHEHANVAWAVKNFRVAHPVPMDNNYAIWRSLNNEFWPADYLIDGQGRVRYHHFGEGDYAKSEQMIQQLLKENGAANVPGGTVTITDQDNVPLSRPRPPPRHGERNRQPRSFPRDAGWRTARSIPRRRRRARRDW